MIEAHNPGVAFDWPRILKGESEPDPRTRLEPADRRPRPERGRMERREADPPSVSPAPEPSAPPAPAEAGTNEGRGPAGATEALPDPVPEVIVDTPAGRRLGAEALGRLRARYAEVTARILERPDTPETPGAQDELKARAERLNPDAWVTDGEVAAGLEQYEAIYESLRAVVGRRRDRRGRG